MALLDRRDGKELLMLRDFIWVHSLEETILVARLSPNILTSTQDRPHFIELSQREERVYIDKYVAGMERLGAILKTRLNSKFKLPKLKVMGIAKGGDRL